MRTFDRSGVTDSPQSAAAATAAPASLASFAASCGNAALSQVIGGSPATPTLARDKPPVESGAFRPPQPLPHRRPAPHGSRPQQPSSGQQSRPPGHGGESDEAIHASEAAACLDNAAGELRLPGPDYRAARGWLTEAREALRAAHVARERAHPGGRSPWAQLHESVGRRIGQLEESERRHDAYDLVDALNGDAAAVRDTAGRRRPGR